MIDRPGSVSITSPATLREPGAFLGVSERVVRASRLTARELAAVLPRPERSVVIDARNAGELAQDIIVSAPDPTNLRVGERWEPMWLGWLDVVLQRDTSPTRIGRDSMTIYDWSVGGPGVGMTVGPRLPDTHPRQVMPSTTRHSET